MTIAGKVSEKEKHMRQVATTVTWFSVELKRKLMTRLRKRNWRSSSVHDLYLKLRREVVELTYAVGNDSRDDILQECLDVAAFAMMIADITRQEEVQK